MQFDTPAQQNRFAQLQPTMRELFESSQEVLEDAPGFFVNLDDVAVQVLVLPFGEDALVASRVYLTLEAPDEAAAYRYLLERNDSTTLGSLGIDEEGDLFVEHTLPACGCAAESLLSSILAVASTAEFLEAELATLWGAPA